MSSDEGVLTRKVRLTTWILLVSIVMQHFVVHTILPQALIPYLRTKLDQYYQVVKEQRDFPDGDSHELKFTARCFLQIYPIIHFSWEVSWEGG